MELYDTIEDNTEKVSFWTKKILFAITMSGLMVYSYFTGAFT